MPHQFGFLARNHSLNNVFVWGGGWLRNQGNTMYSSNALSPSLCQISRPVLGHLFFFLTCLDGLPISTPASCVCLILVGAPRTGVRVVVTSGWWELNVGPLEKNSS